MNVDSAVVGDDGIGGGGGVDDNIGVSCAERKCGANEVLSHFEFGIGCGNN